VMDYLNPFGFVSEQIARDIVDLPMNGAWDGNARLDENGAGAQFGYQSPTAPGSRVYGGSANVGTWQEGGGTNRGVNVEVGGYKTGQQDSGYTLFGQKVGWDMGIGTANAGVYDRTTTDENGLQRRTESAGAGANAIEGSLTVGDDSGGIRVGASEGMGLAARRHMVDIDGDGEMELNGFGLDIGPASFDIKSDMLAELLQDAPELAFDDLDEIGDIPDIIANPLDYMPDLDDYEMPSLDNLPDFDNYELPDFGDLPDFSMPDFFGGGDSAEAAPMPPTGLLDETDIELINNGYDPDMICA
jgi:hypothetical protein